jgi:hypothetical protein
MPSSFDEDQARRSCQATPGGLLDFGWDPGAYPVAGESSEAFAASIKMSRENVTWAISARETPNCSAIRAKVTREFESR